MLIRGVSARPYEVICWSLSVLSGGPGDGGFSSFSAFLVLFFITKVPS